MEKKLLWDITSKCNLRCKHCYANNKYDEKKSSYMEDMNIDDIKTFLNKVYSMGFNHVHLLGGEPLLHKNIIEIIKFARNLGIKISMNTNGILLTQEMIDIFIDLGVSQIFFSFEGITEETYGFIRGANYFEIARNNLKTLGERVKKCNSDMLVGISFTITKLGVGDISSLFNFAVENSARGITIDPLSADGKANEFWEELYVSSEEMIDALENFCVGCDEHKNSSFLIQMNVKPAIIEYLSVKYRIDISGAHFGSVCKAGEQHILVENSGVITPCGLANKPEKNQEIIKQGVLTTEKIFINEFDSFDDIKKTSFFKSFLELKKNFPKDVISCAKCAHNEICKPCPIECFSSKEIKECDIAIERMNELKNKLWHSQLQIDLPNNKCKLNKIGNLIIEELNNKKSLSEISKQLSLSTSHPLENIEKDIWKFISFLLKHNYAKSL